MAQSLTCVGNIFQDCVPLMDTTIWPNLVLRRCISRWDDVSQVHKNTPSTGKNADWETLTVMAARNICSASSVSRAWDSISGSWVRAPRWAPVRQLSHVSVDVALLGSSDTGRCCRIQTFTGDGKMVQAEQMLHPLSPSLVYPGCHDCSCSTGVQHQSNTLHSAISTF